MIDSAERADFNAIMAADVAAGSDEPIGLTDLQLMFWMADQVEPQVLAGQLARFDYETIADDPIGRLAQLHAITSAAEAEKLKLRSDLANRQYLADAADNRVPEHRRGRIVVLELSQAERVASRTAAARVEFATTVVEHHPLCLGALEAGDLSLSSLHDIVAATAELGPDLRARADQLIAADVIASGLIPSQVRQAAIRRVVELDPEAAARRAGAARVGRHVSYRPLPDTISELVITTRAEDALRAMTTLDADARTARADGDTRTIAQLMADLAIERITGASTSESGPVEVQVVIGANSLLGDTRADADFMPATHEPAMIRGYGTIPADLARELATSDKVWLRRLVADPTTGHLVGTNARVRLFRGELRQFLTLRHQTCAVSTCGAPIAHAGHITDHAAGGATTAVNGYGLCENHNYDQNHPGVSVEPLDRHGASRWTLPSGHTYDNYPPPILGPGSGDPPF